MTNLDSILKSRDISLPTKVHLVKAMVFLVVMYGCERWTIKKEERGNIGASQLWCWRRLQRVPWTARRSNQSILKEISPEYSLEGLISFRIDWCALLSVQGTLKSLLQHHSSKASILQHSAFFIVHLSHPYMTPGKTIALTRWTLVDKIVFLLFNMLSRLVITFLPRSKRLNFMAAVTICSDFGAQENSLSLFPFFPHLFAMK